MWNLPCWPLEVQQWDDDTFKLLALEKTTTISEVTVEEIIDKSAKFPVKFPLETVRCKYLKDKNIHNDIVKRNINSVYPILHEKVLYLIARFLLHKKSKGTPEEKAFYSNLSVVDFIERLLTKKVAVFVGVLDSYLLIDGSEGAGNWESIGTSKETEKINLSKCLSYDELKLSALISTSSYTYFINDGNRKNCGKWSEIRENIEDEGIIISLIGTRFEKANVMEYQEIIVSKEQNTKMNGYDQEDSFKTLMANFYDEEALTFDQVIKKHKEIDGRYLYSKNIYFDHTMYAKRMSLSFDTLLLEANERAKNANKTAFIHVVGIGLGVWKISSHQKEIFLEIFFKRIQFLGKILANISDIFFDHFDENSTPLGYKNADIIPIENHSGNGIRVCFGKRNPHEKLTGDHQGKLLVVSYAADSNTLPGNIFWHGCLSAASDSAAASSTQIAELQNPFINSHVSVANLKIATLNGVLTLKEYVQNLILGRK